MARRRSIWLGLAAALWLAPAAVAMPPANDNFAAAPTIGPPGDQPIRHTFAENVDTTEATVEAQLVSPLGVMNRREPTSCRPDFGSTDTAHFGRSIWYLMRRPATTASATEVTGLDTTIAVYDYDSSTGLLGERMFCANRPGTYERIRIWGYERSRDEVLEVAVQVASTANGLEVPGGPLQVAFNFYPDSDLDGAYDSDDRCPRSRGPSSNRGCLPRLRAAVNVVWVGSGSSARITRATVKRIASGSTVELRCVRRCGVRQTRGRASGSVRLTRLVGRTLPSGAAFVIRVTHPVRRSGAYVFGAIGQYVRFDVRNGGLRRTNRCLLPGSSRPRRSCR